MSFHPVLTTQQFAAKCYNDSHPLAPITHVNQIGGVIGTSISQSGRTVYHGFGGTGSDIHIVNQHLYVEDLYGSRFGKDQLLFKDQSICFIPKIEEFSMKPQDTFSKVTTKKEKEYCFPKHFLNHGFNKT